MLRSPQIAVLSTSLGCGSLGPYHSKVTSMANAAASCGVQTTLVLPEGPRPQLPQNITVLQVPNVFNPHLIKDMLPARDVQHVLPLREACVETAAELSTLLGHNTISLASAKLARDKLLMKQAARAAGLNTADFFDLNSDTQDLQAFAKAHNFQLVLKPRTGFGCLGTKIVRSQAELLAALAALGTEASHYILESFVHARAEYHVDLLFRGGEILFSELCRYPEPLISAAFPGNMTRHYARTAHEDKMIELGKRMLRAFHVHDKTGLAHIEFFLTPDQRILFGEAALRLPGGSIVPLYKAFTGIDLAEAWILALLDKSYKPEARYSKDDIGTELLAAPQSGRVLSVPKQTSLPGLIGHELWLEVGDTALAPEGSTGSRVGHYIYSNGLPPDALDRRNAAIRRVLIGGFEIETV